MSSVPPASVYLQPGFDSSSLKVAQLRGILVEHSVSAPSNAKKADLIQLFEERVRPKASELLARASSVQPSSNGIFEVHNDGSTVPMKPVSAPKTPRKRKSTAAPTPAKSDVPDVIVSEAENEVTAGSESEAKVKSKRPRKSSVKPPPASSDPDTPKPNARSRKSSAKPAAQPDQAPATSDAEPEQVTQRKPRKSVNRQPSMSKLEEAVESPQRKELADLLKVAPERFSVVDEEAGFSDYNPFQSGGESPMPMPKKEKKSRRSTLKPESPSKRSNRQEINDFTYNEDQIADQEPEVEESVHTALVKKNRLVQEKFAGSQNQDLVTKNAKADADTQVLLKSGMAPSPKPLKSIIALAALALAALAYGTSYRAESVAIGFCDPGSNTNPAMMERQAHLAEARACIARRADMLRRDPKAELSACPFETELPILPLPRPSVCTPCPQNGFCEDGIFVKCDLGHIETPHALAILNPLLNGLPEPVAFPPTCEKDYKRKKQVLEIARAVEAHLAQRHGDALCSGKQPLPSDQNRLLSEFSAKTTLSKDVFELNFREAIQDLIDHGDVKVSAEGLIAVRAEMTLACRARLAAAQQLKENRKTLAAFFIRRLWKSRQNDDQITEKLVQEALMSLQDQAEGVRAAFQI